MHNYNTPTVAYLDHQTTYTLLRCGKFSSHCGLCIAYLSWGCSRDLKTTAPITRYSTTNIKMADTLFLFMTVAAACNISIVSLNHICNKTIWSHHGSHPKGQKPPLEITKSWKTFGMCTHLTSLTLLARLTRLPLLLRSLCEWLGGEGEAGIGVVSSGFRVQ